MNEPWRSVRKSQCRLTCRRLSSLCHSGQEHEVGHAMQTRHVWGICALFFVQGSVFGAAGSFSFSMWHFVVWLIGGRVVANFVQNVYRGCHVVYLLNFHLDFEWCVSRSMFLLGRSTCACVCEWLGMVVCFWRILRLVSMCEACAARRLRVIQCWVWLICVDATTFALQRVSSVSLFPARPAWRTSVVEACRVEDARKHTKILWKRPAHPSRRRARPSKHGHR